MHDRNITHLFRLWVWLPVEATSKANGHQTKNRYIIRPISFPFLFVFVFFFYWPHHRHHHHGASRILPVSMTTGWCSSIWGFRKVNKVSFCLFSTIGPHISSLETNFIKQRNVQCLFQYIRKPAGKTQVISFYHRQYVHIYIYIYLLTYTSILCGCVCVAIMHYLSLEFSLFSSASNHTGYQHAK